MSLPTTVIDIEAVGGRVVIKTTSGPDLIVGPNFADVLKRILDWAKPRLEHQWVGRKMLCDDVRYEGGWLYWALTQQPGEREQALVLCLHNGDGHKRHARLLPGAVDGFLAHLGRTCQRAKRAA